MLNTKLRDSRPVLQTRRKEGVLHNPLVKNGADPWVIRHSGKYYYCRVRGGRIEVNRADSLQDIDSQRHTVWAPQKDFPGRKAFQKQMWAPELHQFGDKWYIYFAATSRRNEDHRIYVLESVTNDPQGRYKFLGKFDDPSDQWAIDGTILPLNGRNYFIWSGWENSSNIQQKIYIALMVSPTKISGQRVCIASPQYDWEIPSIEIMFEGHLQKPEVNEAPTVLKHDGRVFVIYSASGSWADGYCMGQLELTGKDPLDPSSWRKKSQPVFCSSSKIFGPGHASFIKDDRDRNWMVYHCAKYSGAGWNREVRAQRFTWNMDGSPNFGRPLAYNLLSS
jgi:GH43 family beta-xylosidase